MKENEIKIHANSLFEFFLLFAVLGLFFLYLFNGFGCPWDRAVASWEYTVSLWTSGFSGDSTSITVPNEPLEEFSLALSGLENFLELFPHRAPFFTDFLDTVEVFFTFYKFLDNSGTTKISDFSLVAE